MWVASRSSGATVGLERILRPLQRSSPGTGQATFVYDATVIGHPACCVRLFDASHGLYLFSIMLPAPNDPVDHAAYTKPSRPTASRGVSPTPITSCVPQFAPLFDEQTMRIENGPLVKLRQTL